MFEHLSFADSLEAAGCHAGCGAHCSINIGTTGLRRPTRANMLGFAVQREAAKALAVQNSARR